MIKEVPATIMIVDDDEVFVHMIERMLIQEGYATVTANSGAEAIALFKQATPDCVLLDLIMPEMDGRATCRALRELPGGRDVPVIMLTGEESQLAVEHCYEAGASDYIRKPIHWSVVRHRVRQQIAHARTLRELRIAQEAIEHAGESILITDRDGVIEFVNPAFTKITGYRAEEVLGKTPALLNSGNQDRAFYARMWETITQGKVWKGRLIDRCKDGSFVPVMLTISPIHGEREDEPIAHFIGIQSSLRELEQMEEQFHQAQKMEAIGTLVGGIAHDFNNMLGGITGNLFLARNRLPEGSDIRRRLDQVEEIARRAADMIQQLLVFARKDIKRFKELPLVPFLKETSRLLAPSLPENIHFTRDITNEELLIKGDSSKLHQVLMNLLNNARDAVEGVESPQITLSCQREHLSGAFCEQHQIAPGDYARICVRDNGCGIPQEHLPHLFEPFFTTKEVGKGTGLGLAMVFGAMHSHHGTVTVESTEGEGTTVCAWLPLLSPQEREPERTEEEETTQDAQQATILLADDEKLVLDASAEVLEALGYRVLRARNGNEVLERFARHREEIDLAILDLVMPDCGGDLAAIRLRRQAPALPIILITGYDYEHLKQGRPLPEGCTLMTKPVDYDRLHRRIQKLLRGRS